MSQDNLDDELGIPADASLTHPTTLTAAVALIFEAAPLDASGTNLTDLVTITSSSDSNGDVTVSTQVSLESSIRNDGSSNSPPRSLIVGRQASAADVRVDHKSCSRRNTALYYYTTDDKTVLVVQDLGGKHGTHVDNKRLEKNGKVGIALGEANEHVIHFGNAPCVCRVVIPATKVNGEEIKPQKQDIMLAEENEQTKRPQNSVSDAEAINLNSTEQTPTVEEAPTRQSREAQIAAMIASFDADPVYKPYVPPEEEVSGVTGCGLTDTTNNGTGKGTDTTSDQRNNKYNLPIMASISLTPGSNSFTSADGTNTPLQANSSVSALCFEPSGGRIVAGHRDGSLRFYDFNGMKPQTSSSSEVYYPPFRIVDSDNDPLDSTGRHVLTCLNPSPSGAQWIVGTTSSQPKVIDREGRTTLFYFLKGDTYVTDSSNTKGHTAGVTGVAFHPLVKDTCWTCGLDGSIRQWDVSGRGKTQFKKLVCQKVVGKCKNEKGQRTQIVSSLSVHPSGRKIVVGTSCGSIQIWNCFGSSVSTRPLGAVYSAHGGTKPVTFVTFSGDGERIASRSDSDDTVRVWDVNRIEKGSGSISRKFNGSKRGGEEEQHSPELLLAICKGLPALNESANCAFGPDGKMLCAGSSIDPRAKVASSDVCGKIKFYQLPETEKKSKSKEGGPKSSSSASKKETSILDPVVVLNAAPNASVLGVAWHPKLNQVAFGTSNGMIKVLYDNKLSSKGALIAASRSIRQSDGLSELLRSRAPTGSAAYLTSSSAHDNIIVPNALPIFREEPKATRKTKERERKDPEKTKMPEPPVTGGIKTGATVGGGITFSQYVKTNANYGNNKNIAGRDPRAELFKYNEGKSFASKAYEGDIQKVLADKTVEEEEEEMKSRKRPKNK